MDVLKENGEGHRDFDSRKVLICRAEEFALLNDGYVDALPALIKVWILADKFSNVVFHNPPNNIEKLTKQLFKKEQIKVSQFKYTSFKYKHLEMIKEKYNDVIIGQPDVLKRLLVYLYPLTKPKYKKPVVLLLYGPAGVGKTETAKFVKSIISRNNGLFRTQLSMHQTSDFASYLFGDNIHKSSLALDLLKRESNVVLLDEFDKCPPLLYSAFYQMFDEGIFVDKNYRVNLEKAIIICTTNFQTEREIFVHLGEAIYSRFDGFIQYTDLDEGAKTRIVEREYIGIYQTLLDNQEKRILDENQTLFALKQEVSEMTNVRNIKNYVKSRISSKIVSHKMNL
ncbi:hypothetical protein AM500_03070 [Bacillus sp. FJAT-18017]|nr:hypothetical protein AM500_03070 [Bacillus sp. FJAT-18017]